jgi:hypothetical protein
LWLTVLVGIFNDDTQAGATDVFFGCAEDPDSGMVHLHDGVDALARAEEEGFDGLR